MSADTVGCWQVADTFHLLMGPQRACTREDNSSEHKQSSKHIRPFARNYLGLGNGGTLGFELAKALSCSKQFKFPAERVLICPYFSLPELRDVELVGKTVLVAKKKFGVFGPIQLGPELWPCTTSAL